MNPPTKAINQSPVICRILKDAAEENLFVDLLTLSHQDNVSFAELNPSYNKGT